MLNNVLSLDSLLDEPLFVTPDFGTEMRHRDEDEYWDHWDHWDQDRMDLDDPWSKLYAAV